MDTNKVVRSICWFSAFPSNEVLDKLKKVQEKLESKGFSVQTNRVCSKEKSISGLCESLNDDSLYLNIGSVSTQQARAQFDDFLKYKNAILNIDLTDSVKQDDSDFFFEVINKKASKSFCFTYVFNNVKSSPFFPSSTYGGDGFSIGLQPTDLSEECSSIEEWLERLKKAWNEICEIFKDNPDFLGIDSSIAPLLDGKGSLINFLKRIGTDFSEAATTNTFIKMTEFIKKENPKPIGLCGLMLPCLEDYELAEEYEKGNFTIERNIYLSLHSGLGIDTFPVGMDESPERVFEILKLVQALSNKYKKPLSARFVSDGKAKIGEKTDFKNMYLKDVIIKKL
jgi:uncharacterized protein (UPF0210 family)